MTMRITLSRGLRVKNSGGLASALLATICFVPTASRAQEIEGSPRDEIRFQNTRWAAPDDVRLQIETYRGHDSLNIQGTTTSITRVEDVVFASGRIEFDLAFVHRIAPRICFGVTGKDEADMVMLNPWPRHGVPGESRLCQFFLTKRHRNSLVLNYRQSSEAFDPSLWVHVRIDVRKKRCRIFIDHDRTPAIDLENPLGGGTIGIQGNCYLRNLQINSDAIGRTRAAHNIPGADLERKSMIEPKRGMSLKSVNVKESV